MVPIKRLSFFEEKLDRCMKQTDWKVKTAVLPITVVFAWMGHTFELHPILTVVAAVAILITMATLPKYIKTYTLFSAAQTTG